jgi:hypothetical protein
VAVLEWEYLKIDLNQRGPREDELDVLNHVGAAGWELVGITATNIAYLKRRVEEDVVADAANSGPRAKSANGQESLEEPSLAHEVAVKYRDPATGDRWTGRGRMARWLKVKQDAGEDISNYLVKPE